MNTPQTPEKMARQLRIIGHRLEGFSIACSDEERIWFNDHCIQPLFDMAKKLEGPEE